MTGIVRVCVFPLVVKSQRNSAQLAKHGPGLQVLQAKHTDARNRGDMYDVAKVGADMQKYMAEHKINPISNIIPIMCQLPIFMSMFFGLRGMANLPVESMCNGGLFWFNDLSMAVRISFLNQVMFEHCRVLCFRILIIFFHFSHRRLCSCNLSLRPMELTPKLWVVLEEMP